VQRTPIHEGNNSGGTHCMECLEDENAVGNFRQRKKTAKKKRTTKGMLVLAGHANLLEVKFHQRYL